MPIYNFILIGIFVIEHNYCLNSKDQFSDVIIIKICKLFLKVSILFCFDVVKLFSGIVKYI